MEHYLLEIGLDICLRIFGTTIAQIKGLTATETVDDDSENQASVSLILFEPEHRPSFATVEVELSLFSLQKRTLHIEVFAEWDEHEVEGLFGFGDVNLESIMQDYNHLKPIIMEGINHFTDDVRDPEKPIRKTSRALTVRYRVYDKDYEENEDYDYEYDIDEIAESSIPYIKSLLDIRSKCMFEIPRRDPIDEN